MAATAIMGLALGSLVIARVIDRRRDLLSIRIPGALSFLAGA